VELSRFDPAENIDTPEDARLWLKQFEPDGTPTEYAGALGDVARAYGMAQLARETGIPVEQLFEALNRYPPRLEDLRPILEKLGVAPQEQTALPKNAAE
jgi:probable addiction module antidote protein